MSENVKPELPQGSTEGGLGLRSIGVRAAVPMLLLIAVIAALAFVAQIERERHSLLAAKDVAGRMVVRVMSSASVAPLEFDDAETLADELNYIRSDDEVMSAAVWRIEDGELAAEPMAAFTKPEAPAILPPTIHDETESTIHEEVVSFSRPVFDSQGKRVGMAQVDLSLHREFETLARSEQLIQRVSLGVALALALLLLAQFRWLVIRPLGGLMRAAQRVERGENARVELKRNDEFGRVGLAFNHMVAAIEDREQKIAAKNAQLTRLFDNMRQAVFSIGPDFEVQGQASRATRALLGDHFEGARFDDYLRETLGSDAAEYEAFTLWIEAVFREGAAGWASLEDLAPREICLRPGARDEVFLSLEFRPIIEDGELTQLMVLATDETDKRRIERNAKEAESRYEREMASLRKILAGGTQLFVDYLRSSGQRIRRCESIVGDTPRPLRAAEVDELFRHGHTIKGEARTFELLDLRDAAARLEDTLASARSALKAGSQPDTARLHAELRAALAAMREAYDTTRRRFVEASPLGEGVLDQTTVSRRDLEQLVEHARQRKAVGDAQTLAIAERLASRPFAESVVPLVDAVPTWAEKLSKQARLVYTGGEVRVSARLAEVLPGVLTHLVRNALSHGIEPPAARTAAGKDRRGLVSIRCRQLDAGVEIMVSDDGAGLDRDAIMSSPAARAGAPATSAEHIVLGGGVSTSSGDELSGRGVGLSAVREDLAAVGYGIEFVDGEASGVSLRMRPL